MGRRPAYTIAWDVIRDDFISSTHSITFFLKKYKVSYTTFRAKMRSEKWEEEQKKFQRTRIEVAKKAVLEETDAAARAPFKTAQEVRAGAHEIAGHLREMIKDTFIDPKTGKKRAIRPSPRMIKDLVDSLEKTYSLEMRTAGHALDPETVNHRVLIAGGISIDQMANLSDEALDKVLAARDLVKTLPDGSTVHEKEKK